MKKALIIIFILAFVVNIGFSQEKKFQASIFGGINHVFEYGSEDDYEMGGNDFPVTPAHTSVSFGAAFAYFFTNNLSVELDGRYMLGSNVTLEDPSDQDTVEITTSKHYSLTLNFIYHFLSGKFRPYLVVGGGIDKLIVKDETYTSEYGYEIEFIAPEKTIDPLAQVGAGIQYFMSQNLGVRLDIRYVLIFDDPNNVSSIHFVGGALFRF